MIPRVERITIEQWSHALHELPRLIVGERKRWTAHTIFVTRRSIPKQGIPAQREPAAWFAGTVERNGMTMDELMTGRLTGIKCGVKTQLST
jgi:hypothetical protein